MCLAAISTVQALALFASSHMHSLVVEIISLFEDTRTSHEMKLRVLEALVKVR